MIQYQTILVGLDGSAASDRALEKAIELAQKCESKLVLANVMDMQYFSMAWLNRLSVESSEQPEVSQSITDYQRAYSREVVAAAKAKVPETVPYEVAFEVGSPRKQLVQMIAQYNVDLVVVGTSGMSNLTGMIVGSVSDYVVRHSSATVLVVR